MQYKPISILILAALYFLGPFLKLLFFALFYKISFYEITILIFDTYSLIKLFALFGLPILAGVAIYKVKNWSFWVFVVCEIGMLAANLSYLKILVGVHFPIMTYYTFGFSLLSIIVCGYFLLPAIRLAYFDPRIRWWEANPRYEKELPVKINKNLDGKILNFSESGIFLNHNLVIELDSVVNLEITYHGIEIKVPGRVIYHFNQLPKIGYGVQFVLDSTYRQERKKIHQIVKLLEKEDVPRRPKKRTLKTLLYWRSKAF
jgi:hypothetical protein